jgi:hypothetical protein
LERWKMREAERYFMRSASFKISDADCFTRMWIPSSLPPSAQPHSIQFNSMV